MGDRWGWDGPPEDAYGRVSDPTRFAPLHAAARRLLDELERTYEVRRETGTAPDPGGGAPAPLVRLVPAEPGAAALAVVLTRFPGLLVRSGHEHVDPVPVCGCDACDETLPECLDQLHEVAAATVAGTLGERLVRTGTGWVHERWYAYPDGGRSSGVPVRGAELTALRAALPGRERTYAPWQARALTQ